MGFAPGVSEQGERTADVRLGLAVAFQVGVDFGEPLQSRGDRRLIRFRRLLLFGEYPF